LIFEQQMFGTNHEVFIFNKELNYLLDILKCCPRADFKLIKNYVSFLSLERRRKKRDMKENKFISPSTMVPYKVLMVCHLTNVLVRYRNRLPVRLFPCHIHIK